ncbi:MAG: SIS domain-containing protein [Clostridiales bacterium]|nr:SIS domain-containing protein [Clostridiales bacterium]
MNGSDYISIVTETIDNAWNSQADEIAKASSEIAAAIIRKNNVFVFGCSHAGIIAEEVFYRTGGLAVINPIFFPGFMLNTRPITMTSALERVPGLGKIIFEKNNIGHGDCLIIHSVSGRNTVPVDMALEARRNGVKTICITNLSYSNAVDSRHPDGKRLFEVCDIVIDNKGVIGDAAITIDGLPEKIGPTSTTVGTALINGIVIEAVNLMISEGIVPPVLMSANLDGGDRHNEKIFEEYRNNIFYM